MKVRISIGIGGVLLAATTIGLGVYLLHQQTYARKLAVGSLIALTAILIVLIGLISLKISRNSQYNELTKDGWINEINNKKPINRINDKPLNFFTGTFVILALAPTATFIYYLTKAFADVFKGNATFKECWNNLDRFNQNTIMSAAIITGILLVLIGLLAIGAILGRVKDNRQERDETLPNNPFEDSPKGSLGGTDGNTISTIHPSAQYHGTH